ncbi:TIR domain-containing protein [Streptomyces prunicolor]|uniref:TIR domain-containing protein n=1 Tax=Streptomyces prunicolor TaxID=67348 RepID=A0ABU4F638_9ACTN|nr:TIR domain-containing protein [Streptomyces prunicolor]MDV7215483.1 TIR domain-containing protein [Streptomyces prunicolor]
MAYRNKTYVAFASEDIRSYYLMKAWRENEHIEFDFFDAHDINTALDTSQPETIRRRLGERLSNTKQTVVLLSSTTKPKAGRSSSFLYYEIEAIKRRNLSVVFVNLNQSRTVDSSMIPTTLKDHYSMNVSFQPAIIKYALDDYVERFNKNLTAANPLTGPYQYKAHVYKDLGL